MRSPSPKGEKEKEKMLKIRLEGTEEEIEEFLAGFRPAYKILSESQPYANRGKSAYVRVYLDVEQYSIAELMESAERMMSRL